MEYDLIHFKNILMIEYLNWDLLDEFDYIDAVLPF